jgi:EAL domain-containing protein (putative c-di-GMP-specific phosphodiesterase class I)
MAFQPIIRFEDGSVFAQEALVRGPEGQGAGWVLGQVDDRTRYAFDQACRVTAIREAASLGLHEQGAMLSINFLPNAVYEPANCILATLRAAERYGFPLRSLMFEVTEGEKVRDTPHLARIISAYKEMGFTVAIDDFGAGYAGLNLLSEFRPDIVKLDMELVRGVDTDRGRRAILRGVLGICEELGIQVIAEGIETEAELETMHDLGVRLFQGYLIAPPALGALPEPRRLPPRPLLKHR